MMELNTFKKKSKMSMKYFLRKDSISYVLGKIENKNQRFQLYIEFIFRTKANKCKSVWKDFIQRDSLLFENLNNDINNKFLGYGFSGVSDNVFTNELQATINSKEKIVPKKNDDFKNALIYEKYHAEALFELIRELDESKFSMSKFGSEYKNSVIFVYDIFEMEFKEKLLQQFYQAHTRFPSIISKSITFDKLLYGVADLISIMGNSQSSLKPYDILRMSVLFERVKEYVCFSDNMSCANGITFPVWIIENHSEKLRILIGKQYSDLSAEEKYLLFEIIKNVDNQILIIKENLLIKMA